MNFHFTARGGDISSVHEEFDGTFSQFIESFESELSEIRREAEIEAEIEMQKLLGLVDRSGKLYDDSMEETPDENEEMDLYDVLEEADDAVQNADDRKDSTTDEIDQQYESLGVIDESELSVNEQDTSESILQVEESMSESLQHFEEDTYDLDEDDVMPVSVPAVDEIDETGELEVQLSVDDDTTVELDTTTGISVDLIESVPKIKPKKKHTSKSKKKIATKSRKETESSIELMDHSNFDVASTTSSVIITEEKPIQSRGLRFYMQTDLVRSVFLFIATVVITIWLQRLQKQMEAQGI
jgi:hypothetical protein